MSEPTETEIQAHLERQMADPEWIAAIQRGREDARAGRFIPWRLAVLPLPRWAFAVLFWIAPYTWGRKFRRKE